jgi:hypothetical protein
MSCSVGGLKGLVVVVSGVSITEVGFVISVPVWCWLVWMDREKQKGRRVWNPAASEEVI